MTKTMRALMGAGVALLLAGTAQAGVNLFAGRIGAVDVASLAKFYESAFGLKEVNRFQFPNMLEIILNFGDSAEAAKKNASPQVVIMQRASNDTKDSMPHLIFGVTDMSATVAAIKAAGGTMEGEPREFGKTGTIIGMAIDPAGNHIELIQQPKR